MEFLTKKKGREEKDEKAASEHLALKAAKGVEDRQFHIVAAILKV